MYPPSPSPTFVRTCTCLFVCACYPLVCPCHCCLHMHMLTIIHLCPCSFSYTCNLCLFVMHLDLSMPTSFVHVWGCELIIGCFPHLIHATGSWMYTPVFVHACICAHLYVPGFPPHLSVSRVWIGCFPCLICATGCWIEHSSI